MEKTVMYWSLKMGNLVDSKLGVIRQVFESLFKYHTLDLKWKPVYFDFEEDYLPF